MFGASDIQSNWNPCFFEQGGLFDVFRPWREWFLRHVEAFPDLENLTEVAHQSAVAPVLSGGGFPVRFVRQQRILRSMKDDLGWRANYQMRIFLSGEVPSRPSNWHDFFNAWTWIFFPKLKAAINARHFHSLDESLEFPWKSVAGNRNREQDMLTLFDEGGLLVVTEDDELWDLICRRQWSELFLANKKRISVDVRFLPVGHALFECALKGHPKLHASCVRVRAEARRFDFSGRESSMSALTEIDTLASLKIIGRAQLRSPDDLHALPVWGIRGWHPRAEDPAFIADRTYFR
jgi:hypothetical protein